MRDPIKHAAYMREWRARNLDHARQLEAASRERNRETRRNQQRAWYAANRETVLARRPPKSESDKAANRAWHHANRERIAERHRAYYQDHKAENNARRQRWEAANPERAKALNWAKDQRRRARVLAASIGNVDRAAVIARGKGLCGICGLPVGAGEISIDHIVPLARGGAHTDANLQLAHMSCNRRKGARLAA